MKKLLSTEEATHISSRIKQQNKTIVIAGGCFDILHIGHITFLEKAKQQGDVLIVLLESDEAIHVSKGENRPINTQADRAVVLQALENVDYVLPLSGVLTNDQYDRLISSLKPDIIATTKHDLSRIHKERQAEMNGAKVVDVTDPITNQSTTRIAELLKKDL